MRIAVEMEAVVVRQLLNGATESLAKTAEDGYYFAQKN